MDIFIKAAAGVMIALVLCLALSKDGKNFSLLLTIAVCCLVFIGALSLFSPVIDLIQRLRDIGNLDPQMIEILMKAVGVGLLAEITGMICADAGNAAMGKTLQLLASVVILCMSVPLLSELLELIEIVLGKI